MLKELKVWMQITNSNLILLMKVLFKLKWLKKKIRKMVINSQKRKEVRLPLIQSVILQMMKTTLD